MSYKPFYISSFENESGVDTYYESFLIPEKAFPQLEDAFAWRGKIRRRDGFSLLGRLGRSLNQIILPPTINANTYHNADILSSIRASEPNAEIASSSVFISLDLGGPNDSEYSDDGSGTIDYDSGPYLIIDGSINYVTGELNLDFGVIVPIGTSVTVSLFYYPGLPVMGLPTRETANINDEELIAFDTKYAYHLVAGAFEQLPSVPQVNWNGNNSDFFWSTNYWKDAANNYLFWTTNFNRGATPDPIRYWDTVQWNTFNPIVNGVIALQQCRIIIPYKDRLIVMNTWEGVNLAGAQQFPQRVRWSQNGTPLPTVDVDAWRDDIIGKGGFLDAPTNEQIISAEFIKDVLLVKFERSSWKLLYTGNETLPFIFQKINTELGAESTFSLVPFDRGVFSVGNVGILTDDSVNVERIDLRIINDVFTINNDNEGVKRVHGIRDYVNELVYWTFPNSAENPTFPNKILIYNYRNETWAIFNDSFTCFGYFQRTSDVVWATLPYRTWSEWIEAWNSGALQSKFPEIVGGNQQGFIEILMQRGGSFNDVSLAITNIIPNVPPIPVAIVIPNHNLQTGQFIKIIGIQGIGAPNPSTLNDIIYKVEVVDANTIIVFFLGPLGITQQTLDIGGIYIGGGKVQVINNINILTKRFSPFYEIGSQVRLGYVDFLFDKTELGEITVNLFIDESDDIIVNDPINDTSILGNAIVLTRPESPDIPFQTNQQKIWHRFYTYVIAQNYQLQLTFSDAQMFDEEINDSNVVLHAMTMYLSPNARMIQ